MDPTPSLVKIKNNFLGQILLVKSYINEAVNNSKTRKVHSYRTVSSPYDCSKRFTLHPLADILGGEVHSILHELELPS